MALRSTALGSCSKSSTGSVNSCVRTLMFVTSAIRRMKRKAAGTMPTAMATVRSTRTVSRKVVSSTATSLFGARNSEMNVRHSLMWKATTTRIAASVARGMSAAQRPKKSVIRSSVMAWVIPATGVRPPFFTFVAVRAIAPVAGIPPNSGDAIFATPCATSSMFERWRPPIMPSATTAESSDSTAASSAIVKAGPASAWMTGIDRCGKRGCGRAAGTAQVTDLAREDDQRDAARESDRHWVGNELDRGAEAEQAEGDEDEAGHERRDDEPVDAVLLHDSRHDHHERARRPPDLDARAAQQRDEETGDDGGIESALGTEPARDRERNRERQRDDADDDAGDQVPGKLLPVVVLDGGEKLGDEHGAEKILNSRMHSISALALLLTLQ